MEFRILGPVEFWADGRPHDLGWAQARLVLAIMLMNPGRPISTESIIGKVWDHDPPSNARDLLYPVVRRLRVRLDEFRSDVRLVTRAGAYILDTDPENIDYHRYRALHSKARSMTQLPDVESAIRLYRAAASLWRGEPLSGLSGTWASRTRMTIEEVLLAGTVAHHEFELRHGRHADLVPTLADLTLRHPLNEKLVGLLMEALYRGGRQSEALATFRDLRGRLVEAEGTDPGPDLIALRDRILNADPSLLTGRRPPAESPPNNLPRDNKTFTGRTDELRRLIGGPAGHKSTTVITIDGMAGVGKTTLAIHAAHRLADAYPDGSLYLDLHGHSAEHESMEPATALARLLHYFGVLPARVPSGFDERAALWRTMVARRKVLILLDDASRHEQVSHLLPGGSSCLVIVTSRQRLTGLDGVRSVSLDVLPPEDGSVLFGRVVGPERALPPDDVATVTRLCGNLPLAIQLVGNRLRHLPAWSVADLAQKLARSRRLTEIRAGNRALVAAFDLSYHGLDSTQQQAFRRLGLYPGTDITPANAAALLDVSQVEAEKRLEELHDHHLIAEPRRGRYRFHDLIADYARLLAEDDPQTIRAETQRRLFDFYLAAARAADRLVFPYHMPLMPGLSDLPDVSGLFDDQDSAISWLNTELDNIRALIRYAATHGWPRHSAAFPHALSRYLDLWGHWAEAAALHRDALVAWRELGDPAGEALALADLARMCWRTAQYDEALRLAAEALALQRARGNEHAVADLLEQHGLVHWHRAEYDVARDYAEKALDLRRSLGDRRGQGAALNLIGITLWHLRNNAAASQRLREALALYRQDGDRRGQQVVLTNIGDIELELGHAATALRHYEDAMAMGPHLGAQQATLLNNIANAYQCMDRYTEALDHYRDALALYQRTGDRRSEADALNNIGRCYTRMGRDDRALIHHQQALRIAVEISERYVQTHTLRNIGTIHHRAQRYDSALEHYRSSLERAKEISDIRQEADTLRDIGITMSSLGDVRQARAHWRQALALFEQLGLPEAAVVQEFLSGIDKATGS